MAAAAVVVLLLVVVLETELALAEGGGVDGGVSARVRVGVRGQVGRRGAVQLGWVGLGMARNGWCGLEPGAAAARAGRGGAGWDAGSGSAAPAGGARDAQTA